MEIPNPAKHSELQKEIRFLLAEIARRIHRIQTCISQGDLRRSQKDIRTILEEGLVMLFQTQQMLLEIADFVVKTKKQTLMPINHDTLAEYSRMRDMAESAVLLKEQAQCLSDLLLTIHPPEENNHGEMRPAADNVQGIH